MNREKNVTIPFERTRALIQTRDLLKQLQEIGETPSIPNWLRAHAKELSEHYLLAPMEY